MPKVKEKKERALGVRLHLKGERCDSPKCAMVRKPYPPGAHGKRRAMRPSSEFGSQLKEKQKFKLSYGIDERNLKRIFIKAAKSKRSSAEKLVEFLERRLDNVVFRLGFASSRGAARQLVSHGHVAVNGRRVRSPAFEVVVEDIVVIGGGSGELAQINARKEFLKKYEPPPWLSLDKEKLEGKILALPKETDAPFEINLLVESFNK